MDWSTFFEPIALSIQVSIIASILVFFLSLLVAWKMARARFYGKSLVETVLMLPLVLPPTVVGLVLLYALGRRSWLGSMYEAVFGGPIIFTWGAAVIAAVVVAFPLAFRAMKAGFESVDADLEDSARANGASEWQVFRFITIPLSLRSLTSAYILGFCRGLGEFGATLMIAGNIPGITQTVPTAIYVASDGGNMHLAWAWSGAILLLSFLMLLLSNRVTKQT